jgi:lipopolysaccharide/colanic/teichoic acid biosynthesis glycosyltransferase
LKRSFDFLFALLGLVVLFPVFCFVGLIIHFTSPGPIFYASPRVGLNGKLFKMFKFRSMVTGADREGPLITSSDDCRVTRIGRFLRHTKLDELPTLLNVLKGDMSLVGPRPENPKSAALYNEEQRRIWRVRPGITSLATIKYRNEETLLAGAQDLEAKYFEIMQDKLRLELEYIRYQSLWLDIRIILRTFTAIMNKETPNA